MSHISHPPSLSDPSGVSYPLGPQLFEGGEGKIYAVVGAPDLVAKVYDKPGTSERSAKLREMINRSTPDLLKFAAWPKVTLHERSGDPVAGFVMPKLLDCHEIHNLYAVGDRKKMFPGTDWRFLAHAARNCALAFESVHLLGHVIGDVNPKNVFVTDRALIRLVDCDSFQIRARDQRVFRCGVGMPDFTPPELHGSDLKKTDRTADHDRFGLAVLIFSLLMMGRHPFAGCYSGPGDLLPGQAVREQRYAYSPQAASWQMAAPPNTVPINELSPRIAAMFERAFAPSRQPGSRDRPTAREWKVVLHDFMSSLVECKSIKTHVYPPQAGGCPWCRIATRIRSDFFPGPSKGLGLPTLDIDKIWAEIERLVASVTGYARPSVPSNLGRPLSSHIPRKRPTAPTLVLPQRPSLPPPSLPPKQVAPPLQLPPRPSVPDLVSPAPPVLPPLEPPRRPVTEPSGRPDNRSTYEFLDEREYRTKDTEPSGRPDNPWMPRIMITTSSWPVTEPSGRPDNRSSWPPVPDLVSPAPPVLPPLELPPRPVIEPPVFPPIPTYVEPRMPTFQNLSFDVPLILSGSLALIGIFAGLFHRFAGFSILCCSFTSFLQIMFTQRRRYLESQRRHEAICDRLEERASAEYRDQIEKHETACEAIRRDHASREEELLRPFDEKCRRLQKSWAEIRLKLIEGYQAECSALIHEHEGRVAQILAPYEAECNERKEKHRRLEESLQSADRERCRRIVEEHRARESELLREYEVEKQRRHDAFRKEEANWIPQAADWDKEFKARTDALLETRGRLKSTEEQEMNTVRDLTYWLRITRDELAVARSDYVAARKEHQNDLVVLKAGLSVRRKQEYLKNELVVNAGLPGVNMDQLKNLVNSGIKSAYDVDRLNSPTKIPGIGPKTITKLLVWRKVVEGRFRLSIGDLSPQERQAVDARYAGRLSTLTDTLEEGKCGLQRTLKSREVQRAGALAHISALIVRANQAEVDLQMMET